MEIYPIATSVVNWGIFTKACEKALGYNPTRKLDSEKLTVGTPESFLMALDSFKNNESNIREIKNFSCNHVSISFLMVLDNNLYYEVLENLNQNLAIIRSDNFNDKNQVAVILTGSLLEWKNICIEANYSYLLREFSYRIYELLRNGGYSNIFNAYRITEKSDGSKLFEKRY
jgi:hypothetical protein